jgi:hypothetical protein
MSGRRRKGEREQSLWGARDVGEVPWIQAKGREALKEGDKQAKERGGKGIVE